jgi:hypothetical protein
MGPLPGKDRRVAVDVRVTETHQERGYVRQKISFANEPGDRVPAWLLVPDGGKRPFDFPELIGALAPRAFFTNSPLHDTNFAIEGVRVCLAAAQPIYVLLGEPDQLQGVFPDAGHAFPPSSRQTAFAFLHRALSSSH